MLKLVESNLHQLKQKILEKHIQYAEEYKKNVVKPFKKKFKKKSCSVESEEAESESLLVKTTHPFSGVVQQSLFYPAVPNKTPRRIDL